jgi:hypothetical protein
MARALYASVPGVDRALLRIVFEGWRRLRAAPAGAFVALAELPPPKPPPPPLPPPPLPSAR